jgi:hypothetical protein
MGTEALFWVGAGAYVIFIAFGIGFTESLKEEAPTIYQALGAPSASSYAWNRTVLLPFSGVILMHRYRTLLASHPRSRAWASWLFVAHWVQLIAMVAFVLSFIVGAHEL